MKQFIVSIILGLVLICTIISSAEDGGGDNRVPPVPPVQIEIR